MKEEKILKRDEKLLRNEKSWRRARIGAFFIATIQILVSFLLCNMPSEPGEKVVLVPEIASILFWLLIITTLNMRLNHIDSIKLYRSKLNQ